MPRWHDYVSYAKAREFLAKKLGAAEVEVRQWIFLGSSHGGLDIYVPPMDRRRNWSRTRIESSPTHDPTDFLARCYLRNHELATFRPQERYISWVDLKGRWASLAGSEQEAAALIDEEVAAEALVPLHPVTGVAGLGISELPDLSESIFDLAHVEGVERQREMPVLSRDELICRRHNELKRSGFPNPTQRIVKQFRISDGLVRRILRKQRN
jgi:hypothetical protein